MSNQVESLEANYEKELHFERLVSIYFRISLLMSGLLMLTGLIMFILNPETSFDFININISTIAQEITTLTSVGLMFSGIVILLLIPLGRVIILLFYYLMNNDYRLMICSAIVLVFMLIGIIFNVK